MRRRTLVLFIVFISGAVGWIFAAHSPTENSEVIFRTLATLQGSFLAIVVSIFILSQQVTASEYTPVALREMRDDPAIDALILLFISSILIDIWYHLNIQLEPLTLNTELNVEVGTAVGLTTLCLLLLIPARRHVIEAVGPENVLDSTVNGIKPKSFPSKENSGLDSPPERNPLLAIDQVLQSAKARGDEFTIQRAIYDMHRATKEGISGNEQAMQAVDGEGLFEYWDNCIETATQGGPKRGKIAARGLREVIVELVKADMAEYVDGRLEHLNNLFVGLYNEGNLSMDVLNEFRYLARVGAQQNEPIVHSLLIKHHYEQVSHIIASENEIDGTQTDQLLREIIFNSFHTLIIASNLGFDRPQFSDSTGLEDLVERQAEMHKMFIEEFSVSKETIGNLADRLAVLTATCEGANNGEASRLAFSLLIEATLHIEDSHEDILTRLSDANLSENRQRELAQSKWRRKDDRKPSVEFAELDESQYIDVYRSMAKSEATNGTPSFKY